MYEVMYTAWRKSALAQRRTEVGSRTVAAVACSSPHVFRRRRRVRWCRVDSARRGDAVVVATVLVWEFAARFGQPFSTVL